MLDIEVITAPADAATDILSVDELLRHMRMRNAPQETRDELEAIIEDVVGTLDGAAGNLNSTLRPMVRRRYLRKFPDKRADNGVVIAARKGIIQLPFPPLMEVIAVTIEDGDSPSTHVDDADYVVRRGEANQIGEIEPYDVWPSVTEGPRAVSITYQAGYTTYPPALRRMVKILSAHAFENPEATINEPRQMMINRKVEYAMDDLRAILRVPLAYGGWDED